MCINCLVPVGEPNLIGMDSPSSSWINVDAQMTSQDSPRQACSFCPLPRFAPNFDGPSAPSTVSEMQQGLQNTENKKELHRILNAVQCSADFGVYFCERFRDPRKHYIDDYWDDVCDEAFGLDELHKAIGRADSSPLPPEALSRLHLFARLLERLARRIDRLVLVV